MQLGRIDLPRDQWPLLSAVLERALSGQAALPGVESELVPSAVRKTAEKAITHYQFSRNRKEESKRRKDQRHLKKIDLNTATTSWQRSLGPELVGHHTYRKLQLPEILKGMQILRPAAVAGGSGGVGAVNQARQRSVDLAMDSEQIRHN